MAEPISDTIMAVIVIAILWDMFWKAIGLYKSVRLGQMWWFVAIYLINSIGIVPIIYLVWFQKKIVKPAPAKPRRR